MRHLSTRHARARARGLTLIELMVALTVGAVLLATAAPYLGDYMSNSRLRENGNLLLGEALFAQGEAIKRNTTVRLSTTGSTIQVLDATVAAAPVLIRERNTTGGITLPAATVNFGVEGRPTPFGTAAAIDVIAPLTCSSELRCPGLRIDAGGAVRLCGNQLSCT